MQKNAGAGDQNMDDILASIRKIISEDSKPAAARTVSSDGASPSRGASPVSAPLAAAPLPKPAPAERHDTPSPMPASRLGPAPGQDASAAPTRNASPVRAEFAASAADTTPRPSKPAASSGGFGDDLASLINSVRANAAGLTSVVPQPPAPQAAQQQTPQAAGRGEPLAGAHGAQQTSALPMPQVSASLGRLSEQQRHEPATPSPFARQPGSRIEPGFAPKADKTSGGVTEALEPALSLNPARSSDDHATDRAGQDAALPTGLPKRLPVAAPFEPSFAPASASKPEIEPVGKAAGFAAEPGVSKSEHEPVDAALKALEMGSADAARAPGPLSFGRSAAESASDKSVGLDPKAPVVAPAPTRNFGGLSGTSEMPKADRSLSDPSSTVRDTSVAEAAVKPVVAPRVETGDTVKSMTTADAATVATTGRSLEDTVSELLRPLLRDWLDQNMGRIVEKAVRLELSERKIDLPKS